MLTVGYCDAKRNTIVLSARQIFALCHVSKSTMNGKITKRPAVQHRTIITLAIAVIVNQYRVCGNIRNLALCSKYVYEERRRRLMFLFDNHVSCRLYLEILVRRHENIYLFRECTLKAVHINFNVSK